MSSTASVVVGTSSPTAGTSNECRMLLNVARYYDVISKIVDILEKFTPREVPISPQVVHKPEFQSIIVCYGEIIEEEDEDDQEECLPEPLETLETLDNGTVKEELFEELPPKLEEKSEQREGTEIEQLPEDDGFTEDDCDEMFFFEEEEHSVLSERDVEVEELHVEEIDLVEEEQQDADSGDGAEVDFDPNLNEQESNVSEYFVEYLQDEETDVQQTSDCIEMEPNDKNSQEIDQATVKMNNIFLIRYKCQFISCDMKFMFAKEYDDHLRMEHSGIVKPPINLQCKHLECMATFNDTYKLYVHHKKHKVKLTEKIPSLLACQICREKFDTKMELKKHLKDHPKRSSGKMSTKHYLKRKCEFCEEILEPKINVYNIHCLEAHGRALYNCFICGKIFYLLTHLSEHIKAGHDFETAQSFIVESLWRSFSNDNLAINECRMCFRLFASPKAELQHKEHHIKELSLTCANCGGKHYEGQCSEPRPKFGAVYEKVQCDQCQRWMSKKNIKEHIATHANERNFPCTVCKKTFKVQRTAHRHIQNHINAQNKLRKCYDCDEVFEDEDLIPGHYESAHANRKPYNCLICGEGFFLKPLLADHSHTHSDEERRRISVKNPVEHYQIGNARVYECTLCRRGFSAKRTTVAHFIVHTDRPFFCQYCSMSFRVKTALEDHLLDVHKVKQ